ncbi:Translin [Rhizoctonia solani]|uniref:Translin n=1 Tax=Rhizoctonia solani TaxID=456999 RepID=A0A8H7IIG3_9AGAM|nr:Translin [Rhizoctonia solani]
MDATQIAARRAEILSAFEGFREEFDENNDRRERIIKTNRDITNHSKKLIFQLHRIAQDENSDEGATRPFTKPSASLMKYGRCMPRYDLSSKLGTLLLTIETILGSSGGLQELIEALSLRHYLLHGQMISYDQVQQFLTSDEGEKYLYLAESDYLLGVSDLTGELMRLAISTITRKGGRDRALHTAAFVRAYFESFAPHVRDLYKKQNETSASLRKIEDALYAIRVREFEHGSEGSFDDIISRFAYQFEKPQNVQDDEGNIGY